MPNGDNIVPNWNVVTNGCGGYTCNFDAVVVLGGFTSYGSYGVRQIDCDPFLRLLRGAIYGRQKDVADAFIAGPFSAPSVAAKLGAWRTQIASAIEDDPLVDSTQWQNAVDDLQANLPKFQSNVSLMMSGLIHE